MYLPPGMFGFARLAAFDYFVHLRRALDERLRAAGHGAEIHVGFLGPDGAPMRLDRVCSSHCWRGRRADSPDRSFHRWPRRSTGRVAERRPRGAARQASVERPARERDHHEHATLRDAPRELLHHLVRGADAPRSERVDGRCAVGWFDAPRRRGRPGRHARPPRSCGRPGPQAGRPDHRRHRPDDR